MTTQTTDTSVAALSAALAAAPPVVEKDDFADAFASFTAPEPAKPPVAEAAAGADGKEPPAPAPEPGSEIEGAPDAAEGEAGKTTPEPEPVKANTTADDAVARLADILTQRQQPAPKPEAPQSPQAPAPLFTEAEAVKLREFYKEWPEVAEATQTLMRAAMVDVRDKILTEVAAVLGPRLSLLEQMANDMQLGQIKEAVPDYSAELEAQVLAWAEKQPDYLKAVYTNVMQTGTSSEVADIVKRYRQETGAAAPASGIAPQATATAAPAPATKEAILSPAAKKAAAALEPVNSKRTGNTQVEPQSFDDAFDAFAKAS